MGKLHLLLPLLFMSLLQPGNAQPHIQFIHTVGDSTLSLNQPAFKNDSGQVFSISRFRYYISHIQLLTVSGKRIKLKSTYLIDEADSATKTITIPGSASQQFSHIEFMVGIDSMHNCSGAQTGVLDPLKGMFWTWNSGYIFMKLEGIAAASPLPGGRIEYHIGGYRTPHNNMRTVSIPLQKKKGNIIVRADIGRLLKNIYFGSTPSITNPADGTPVADNYANMFSAQ